MPKTTQDRHKDHSRQYNVRIPNELLDEFNAACAVRNLIPALMVRTLMQGFVDVAKADAQGAQA